jgi:arylsulfotransferase ASST
MNETNVYARWRSLAALALVSVAPASLAVASSGLACSSSGTRLDEDASADVASPVGSLYLSALTVSPLTLVPAFSPDIHDYYVRCAAGMNAVTVSMTASPGADSALLQPSASASSPKQTLPLSMQGNQAIVAAATSGPASNEYWIRCLPADFPEMQWVPHPGAGAPIPGYYLLGNEQPLAMGGAAYAIVLDSNGVPVWYYREADAGAGVFDVDDVVSGALSFMAYPVSSPSFEVHQLSPFATTYVSPSGVSVDPHELRLLPNGDFLIFSDSVENGVDLTGYTIGLPDGGVESFGPNGSILPCNILEVDPAGKVVWTWIGTDHFDAVQDSTFQQPGPASLHGTDGNPVVDPFHCNSIDLDPNGNGNLLVSARNMDSVFYIDRMSSAVLWKLGGAKYSKDGAAFIEATDPFYRQHDVRFLPGWATSCGGQGRISVFDDETEKPRPARAIVYQVNVGKADGTTSCGTAAATVPWEYPGSVHPEYMGSFRILPDGSRTIGWGFGGELAGLVLTEVDVEGDDLLDLSFTNSASYRAIKVPLNALDLGLMRSTAGFP